MKAITFCSLLLALLLSSCAAPTHYTLGRDALEKENYSKAIGELRLAVKENPQNGVAVRDLGVALFENKSYKNSALILEKALQRLPQDGQTRLYLGRAYEKTGRFDEAIKLYRGYAAAREPDYRRQIEAQLDQVIQAQLRLEARRALANESALAPQSLPEKSIAVLNFRNLGGNAGFDPLAKGLADMVITDLSQVKSLTVVERSRMQTLMEEMGLSQTGLVDEQTAPRVGQLLGAKKILHGSFLDLAGGRLRLDANLADATAPVAQPVGETSGELARFFRVEKNLVFKVIDELGLRLTEAEEKAILTIPTENLLAFLAYSRGLDASDRGDFAGAEKEFQQALNLDPKFSNAKVQLQRASLVRENLQPSRLAARSRAGAVGPLAPAQQRQLRLVRSALNNNPAFSFANRARVTSTLSRAATQAGVADQRAPLLEGANTFGLKGELIIRLDLP